MLVRGKKTSSTQADTASFSQPREKNTALKQENEELLRKPERINKLLRNTQRARFGQSCEKRSYVMLEQLGMFNEAEAEQDHKAPKSTEETLTVKEHQRKRKPKRTAEELKIIPQQVRVVKYYSATYAYENCEKESGYAHIYSVKAPPRPLKHKPGLPLHGGQCHDPEVRGRVATVPAGETLGTGGRGAEPRHDGQLDDPDSPDLTETAVPAAEKASAGQPRYLCG